MTPADEGRPPGAPATDLTTAPNHTPPTGRQRPALLIRLPLEGYGRSCWEAESFEDQQRLILWLARSDALQMLQAWLEGLADWLEEEAA